jgi:hypothetical protein
LIDSNNNLNYIFFKKNPPNIIRGKRAGADIAKAILTDGAAAAIRLPNETEQYATRITVAQQSRYLVRSLFKLVIQYIIETDMNGRIRYLGS